MVEATGPCFLPDPEFHVGGSIARRTPGRMAPKGRKRKADPPHGAEGSRAEKPPKKPKEMEGSGPRVVIEHCQALQETFPNILVEMNPKKPRRNSFEVVLLKEDGTQVELWSGLKKGPPRKLKFPEPTKVVETLKGNLD
ncbi:hypothetical protein JRQ81_000132 [Phrynocephalus forsythii]|uniref:Selenoprotein H n=1 Tax=Phrynocephalus forsythii TaxID=171643 RepID=A0A9Q0Y5G8_9SAUR|nr:hypothetical protein JRQ81_000132 [Phrynocephalus forsythii]